MKKSWFLALFAVAFSLITLPSESVGQVALGVGGGSGHGLAGASIQYDNFRAEVGAAEGGISYMSVPPSSDDTGFYRLGLEILA